MTEDWVWRDSRVVRVIDGDTLVARLTRDIGFHGSVTFEQHLRLRGTDADDIDTPKGKDAADFLSTLVMGVPVAITTEKRRRDEPYKFGDEWMATIVLPEPYKFTVPVTLPLPLPDLTNVSEVMIATGHAFRWDGRGTRPSKLHRQ